jgi:prevent-host-death family protein
MKVYSYSEARQQLAELLNRARREGEVEIRRRDGQVFVVRPAAGAGSPLDVPGVSTDLSREEIVGLVRESRRSAQRFLNIEQLGLFDRLGWRAGASTHTSRLASGPRHCEVTRSHAAYCSRKASVGSIRRLRQAGPSAARKPTAIMTSATTGSTTAALPRMRFPPDAFSNATPKAAPSAAPTASCPSAREKMLAIMRLRSAPSAIRIPISFRRSETVNDMSA